MYKIFHINVSIEHIKFYEIEKSNKKLINWKKLNLLVISTMFYFVNEILNNFNLFNVHIYEYDSYFLSK